MMNKHKISTVVLFILILIGVAGAVVVNIDGSALVAKTNLTTCIGNNATQWNGTVGNCILTSSGEVTNATVNPYSMNASNITTGVLPNASIPASAMNYSQNRTKVVEFTIGISTTGNQTVTDASTGFTPTSYFLICGVAAAGGVPTSIGFTDGSVSGSVLNSMEIAAGQWASTSSIGLLETAAGNYNILTHVSMNANGFTFSKTKQGTPAATVTCFVELRR